MIESLLDPGLATLLEELRRRTQGGGAGMIRRFGGLAGIDND